jgi:hypothetical protein
VDSQFGILLNREVSTNSRETKNAKVVTNKMDKRSVPCLAIFGIKMILAAASWFLIYYIVFEINSTRIAKMFFPISFCLYVFTNAVIYLWIKNLTKLLNFLDGLLVIIPGFWGIYYTILAMGSSDGPFVFIFYPPLIGIFFYGIIGILLNRVVVSTNGERRSTS